MLHTRPINILCDMGPWENRTEPWENTCTTSYTDLSLASYLHALHQRPNMLQTRPTNAIWDRGKTYWTVGKSFLNVGKYVHSTSYQYLCWPQSWWCILRDQPMIMWRGMFFLGGGHFFHNFFLKNQHPSHYIGWSLKCTFHISIFQLYIPVVLHRTATLLFKTKYQWPKISATSTSIMGDEC